MAKSNKRKASKRQTKVPATQVVDAVGNDESQHGSKNDNVTVSERGEMRKDSSVTPNKKDEDGSQLLLRDCSKLYTSVATYRCAMSDHCVPCAYKIGCFDVALDQEFTRTVPNARPEQCPRTKERQNLPSTCRNHAILGYERGMSVLTLGDGDLTFSLAIARIVLKRQETKHGQGKVIASSYESLETLRGIYPKIDDTINELKALGAQVHYEVDATRIMETIPGIEDVKFHRIAWNFPCTAAPSGQDGQNEAMDSNKELVRKFVVNAQSLLCNACGEISMCHKTKPPYNQWQLETVALEQCANKMRYLGRIVLDKTILPPYTPRKALDKKSFACHDACIFVFGMDAATNLTDGGTPTFSSTIPLKCEDKSGILENSVISPDQDDMAIIPVGPAMLRQLRQLHLNERELTKSKQKNRNAQRNEVNRFSGGFNSQKRLKHF